MRARSLIFLGALFLCSCSRVKLAYNFADLYISTQAHKYLKLKPGQEKLLKIEIDLYLNWHRRQMLPAYAEACHKLARGIRGQEKAEDNIAGMMALLPKLYADTMEPLAGPSAVLLCGLDSGQLDFLSKALEKEVRQRRKKYLDDKAVAEKKRLDNAVRYVEAFSGPLLEPQRQEIRELTLKVHLPSEAWILDRQRRSKELLENLRVKKGPVRVKAELKDWWLRERVAGAKADATSMDPKEMKDYFMGVLRVLSVEQKEHAALALEGYARDFEELANKP